MKRPNGGIVDPSTLGAKIWFDGSDVSKFAFSGSDVTKFESSILGADFMDYNSRDFLERSALEDAIVNKIGLGSKYNYKGASYSFSGDFTLLWKAKVNINGYNNVFLVSDNPSFHYIVTSTLETNRYRDSTGAVGAINGGSTLNNYDNLMFIGDGINKSIYVDGIFSLQKAQGIGGLAVGAFMMDSNDIIAGGQYFLKQYIYFDRILNATEITQMNDFLDSK